MKVHLNLTLNEGISYQKVRETILACDTATTKWNESAAISFTTTNPMTQTVDNGGVMPMEVDRLQKGDGKKGKGKGKDVKEGQVERRQRERKIEHYEGKGQGWQREEQRWKARQR